jgi:aminoglycoside 2''-phosphotransferase
MSSPGGCRATDAHELMLQPDWEAIASELPRISIRSAVPIGEGWTATAWRVNDELVFKFPKKPWVWGDLDRELAFLPYARPRLPLSVPEYLHTVRESAGASHGYVVYRHVPGSAVDPQTLTRRERTMLAQTLAHFLRTLHDIDPAPVASILPGDDEFTLALQCQRDADAEIAPRLSGKERRRLSEAFAEHLNDERNFNARSVIVHADLGADHILRLGESVSGVIDWGDVSIGDADYDFNYLFKEFGEQFVREVAAGYGHADPDRLVRKTRYFCLADQIGTIVHGADDALPGDVESAWQILRSLLSEEA